MINGAGPSHIVLQLISKFGLKIGITAIVFILNAQFLQRCHQRLGNEHATVWAEVTVTVRKIINFHYFELLA